MAAYLIAERKAVVLPERPSRQPVPELLSTVLPEQLHNERCGGD